jgi:uncharacterized membrane protein SirB2
MLLAGPVKFVHVTCAVITGAGFFLRGIWMMRASSMLDRRWVRIVPHVVDTVLLGSAVVLAVNIHQYPGVDAWLTAKVAGLVAYVGLGMVALRHGRSRRVRIAAWVAALMVFAYVVAVAVTRSPLPGAG